MLMRVAGWAELVFVLWYRSYIGQAAAVFGISICVFHNLKNAAVCIVDRDQDKLVLV